MPDEGVQGWIRTFYQSVAPDSQEAAGASYPGRLLMEGREWKPVISLGNGDKVKAVVFESCRVGWADGIMDGWVLEGPAELILADIGRLHVGEMRGQQDRRLSVTGSAIPGCLFLGDL